MYIVVRVKFRIGNYALLVGGGEGRLCILLQDFSSDEKIMHTLVRV